MKQLREAPKFPNGELQALLQRPDRLGLAVEIERQGLDQFERLFMLAHQLEQPIQCVRVPYVRRVGCFTDWVLCCHTHGYVSGEHGTREDALRQPCGIALELRIASKRLRHVIDTGYAPVGDEHA